MRDLSPTGAGGEGTSEAVDAVELRLEASPDEVLRAAVEAARRAEGAVERLEAAEPLGRRYRRYRVATRYAGAAGPVVLVYDIADAGAGVTRVRITQCGFGDAAAWDEAFGRWHGWTAPPPALPAGAGPFPWASLRGRAGAGQPAPADRARRAPRVPAWSEGPGGLGAEPALVDALAGACATLRAQARGGLPLGGRPMAP